MNKIVPRIAQKVCAELADTFPVVAITGPRQSGKTTLVQNAFPEKPYVSCRWGLSPILTTPKSSFLLPRWNLAHDSC